MQVLKRGGRDLHSKAVRTTAITLMFHLLAHFAKERNPLAPPLYKTLAFLLLDCFNQTEQRGYLLS